MTRFIYLEVNPEPWAVGPLTLGRRNGKMFPKMERNASVFAFKEAVRGELEDVEPLPVGTYELKFYFWRRLDSYIGESGRKANAHVADATNMQKSLEDALQGLLFENDRDVQKITSVIVEQGADVTPGVAITARLFDEALIPNEIAHMRAESVERGQGNSGFDNTWPPR